MIHVEGYLVQNRNLFRKILEVASGQSLLISLDLASYNVVEQNLDFITEMVRNYVDIVFANEEEARAFTGKGPEEAVEVIASFTHIAVVKKGKDGSLIRSGGRFENVPAMKADVVDTTGAGDLYAAGFLYGL
jgi:sugar/nucleoside kinase (ribokinase family)